MHNHLVNLLHTVSETGRTLDGVDGPYDRQRWEATLQAATDEALIGMIGLLGELYGLTEV